MSVVILLTFRCAACGHADSACPDCVNTIGIDPETGLPPDVEIVNGRAVHKTPTEDAKQRSAMHPVCDTCIAAAITAGKTGLLTAEDRHNRLHV